MKKLEHIFLSYCYLSGSKAYGLFSDFVIMEYHLNVSSNLSVLIFTDLEKRLSFFLENHALRLELGFGGKKETFEFYGILKKNNRRD